MRKAKSVAKFVEERGWDAVLQSEVMADVGVVWISQDAELTAIVHSRKTTILLQGELLKQWCEDGQWKKLSRSSNEVKWMG